MSANLFIESNEVFSAQARADNKGLGLDPAKIIPVGGALGFPIYASGTIFLTKLVPELKRTMADTAFATLFISDGQGIALIVENIRKISKGRSC